MRVRGDPERWKEQGAREARHLPTWVSASYGTGTRKERLDHNRTHLSSKYVQECEPERSSASRAVKTPDRIDWSQQPRSGICNLVSISPGFCMAPTSKLATRWKNAEKCAVQEQKSQRWWFSKANRQGVRLDGPPHSRPPNERSPFGE